MTQIPKKDYKNFSHSIYSPLIIRFMPKNTTVLNSSCFSRTKGGKQQPKNGLLSIAKEKSFLLLVSCLIFLGARNTLAQSFVHPGLLHKQDDLERMKVKVAEGAQPWKGSWDILVANSHSSLTRAHTNPVPNTIYRGFDGTNPENYASLFRDAASAYATALRWKISGDDAYAEKSIAILNAWSASLKTISGTADKFLLAGIQGYQLANAAEIMRTYNGWAPADFARFQDLMLNVFYTMNHDFLVNHNGACISNYWANWDLCNMASMLSIGVLLDRRDIYNEAVEYFKNGAGNGSIKNMVPYLHRELGQFQESGRDQGHAMLCVALAGSFCEMAWNQGDDLYGYDDNRLLKAFEYIAKYNLGYEVPFTTYRNCIGIVQTEASPDGRGNVRPVWEIVYNHYVNRKGLPAPYISLFAQRVRPEGGGGNYGPNSGGYDQLGYGTLTFSLEEPVKPNNQTITFPTIPNKEFGAPDFNPGATSSSGLPVFYSVLDPTIASVNADGTIRVLKPGTTIIYAQQLGNNLYNPAAVAQQTLTVNKLPGTNDGTWSNTAGTITSALASTTGSADLTWPEQTFVVGEHIRLTGTVPSGFTTNTSYTVVAVNGSAFQLALQPGGAAIVARNTISNGTAQRFQKWLTASNWSGAILPSGTNATATFGSTSFSNIGGVTLDENITIGNLVYASNGTSELTLASGLNNGKLTFKTVSGTPGIRMINSGTRKLFLGNANNNARVPLKIAGNQGLNINTPVYGGGNPAGLRIQAGMDWSEFSGAITFAQGTIELHNTTNSLTAADNVLLPPQTLTMGTENIAVMIFTGAGNVASKQTIGALNGTSEAYIIARTAITNGVATLVVGADNQDGNYEGSIGMSPVDVAADKGRINLEKIGSGTQVISGTIKNGTTIINGIPNYSAVALHAGKLILSGGNEYQGTTRVTGGTLEINGTGNSPVLVDAGTFSGSGSSTAAITVGTGSGTGAILAPGIGVGTFTSTSTLTLLGDATYELEYNSSLGSFDKVVAKGITLSNAKLSLREVGTPTSQPAGTTFVILDNTSEWPVTGTFTGLAEGSIMDDGANLYQISYQGGTGNDVVLKVFKYQQAISFEALEEKKVGDYDFGLTATASSGLDVAYTSSNPAVAMVQNNQVKIIAAGTTTITASQAGNYKYQEAKPVSQTLSVIQLPHTPYQGEAVTISGNTDSQQQSALKTQKLSNVLEAEDFDEGGQNIAYYDLTNLNNGRQYRTKERVDIDLIQEGGYAVTDNQTGEWLKYTVRVLEAGDYRVDVRVASVTNKGKFSIEIEGTDATGIISVPNTGGVTTWGIVSKTISLKTGLRVIKVNIQGDNFKMDNLNFTKVAAPNAPVMSKAPVSKEVATAITQPALVLYPNPVTDKLQVSIKDKIEIGATVSVYNATGIKIFAKPLCEPVQTVDLTTAAAGVYLIQVNNGGQILTKKIIKK
jgi:autotransporter-associated beta strand protein